MDKQVRTNELIVAIRSPLHMEERRKAIREAWGKSFTDHGARVLFVVSGEKCLTNVELREDVLYTPGSNAHADLTNRMCHLFAYLQQLSYSHVLVIDDDCSVNVPLFMSLSWDKFEAWGHNSGGYLSGCAAVFSKKTIEQLNYNMTKDDVVIGSILTRLGVNMEHAGWPCPVRPWLGPEGDILSPDVAIQHYVRSPQKIIENHLNNKIS